MKKRDATSTRLTHGVSVAPTVIDTPTGRTLDHSSEWTFEWLYRRQITKGLAISPDIQLLIRPVSKPSSDLIAVFGLRARVVF